MALATSYYKRLAAASEAPAFAATVATVGPWSPKLQHGGPPSALMAREVEAAALSAKLPFVSRMTFQFFRPVKVAAPLRVTVDPLRVGNKAAHFSASLLDVSDAARPVELMRASALATVPRAVSGVAEPPETQKLVPPPLPPPVEQRAAPFANADFGYMRHLEACIVTGRHAAGATEVWAKTLPQSLVDIEGEALTPLQRTLIWADSAGGMSYFVDFKNTSFVNADMTVNLLRPMAGEWCCMRARTDIDVTAGQGLAYAELWDLDGFFGRVSQQQIVEPRV